MSNDKTKAETPPVTRTEQPQPTPPPSPAKDDGKKSPREWFAALKPVGESRRDATNRLMAHNVAATMHGWRQHRHHTGKPIALTAADYTAALLASNPQTTDSGTTPKATTHAAALSPHKPQKKA